MRTIRFGDYIFYWFAFLFVFYLKQSTYVFVCVQDIDRKNINIIINNLLSINFFTKYFKKIINFGKTNSMSIIEKILLLIFTISYLYFTLYSRNKIEETCLLNDNQKKIHNILIWIIPYFWGMFVLRIIKPDKYKTITKKDRKTETNNFYESGKGFHG